MRRRVPVHPLTEQTVKFSFATSFAVHAAAVTALTLAATSARAQLPAGSTLNFSGTADAVDVGAAGVVLTFNPGTVASGEGNTGAFAFLNAAGATGAIREITVGAGPQSIPAFLTLGGYTFGLSALPSGTHGQAECYVAPVAGQRCTPIQTPGTAISPFMLTNAAPQIPGAEFSSVAAFHLVGTVAGPDGAASEFFGTIWTEFPHLSFQEALGGLEQAGPQGLPGVQFAGTFVTFTAAPEPSTCALTALGLAGAAGMARRRRTARA